MPVGDHTFQMVKVDLTDATAYTISVSIL